MQRCLVTCFVGLIVTTGAAAQDRLPRHAKFPKWITDYEAARKVARADGKAMLIVLRCEP